MTADHSPEPGRQRTVAELLQQYGERSGGGSRRRRRADDAEPAVQDGPRPDEPADPYPITPLFSPAPPPPREPPPREPDLGWRGGSGYGIAIDPLTGELIPPGASQADGPAGSSGSIPPTGYRGLSSRADPPTEQLPRYPEPAPGNPSRGSPDSRYAGPMTGPITGPIGPTAFGGAAQPSTERDGAWKDEGAWKGDGAWTDDDGGPPTGQVSPVELFSEADDGSSAGARRSGFTGSPAPAGLAERDVSGEFDRRGEPDRPGEVNQDPGRPVGARAWAGLVVLWLLGAVAGGGLWVGFRYLWLYYPVVALVVAVLATAGLVLVVRAIRRSDDLQTTMLAVLVGLVVTISPAVLLLAIR